MKSLKSLLLLSFFCLLALSCGDDEADYNPSDQFQIDLAQITAYLAENEIEAESDPTGLFYTIDTETSNDYATQGNNVTVNYELYNFDGELLDTNLEAAARAGGIYNSTRQYAPFPVLLGAGRVIPGFERALYLLRLGEKGTFYIPSVLGYQNQNLGNIGPNENLIFVIEMLTIE